MDNCDTFGTYESNVRSYCRRFTDIMETANGSIIRTVDGRELVDFFSGASALNYGHNNPYIIDRVISYMQRGGILHGMDMHTTEKEKFIRAFEEKILIPRGLNYKIQFCGPTGTNAVEAALKLARKNKKRVGIFAFMGAFHGMSLGSLANTSYSKYRSGAGVPLPGVTFFPFPNNKYSGMDTIDYIENALCDDHSGIDLPAAIIVETVQSDGGVNIAPIQWLIDLRRLCDKYDILLICDEVQVGCYRTGPFFSFERAGIIPDIVTVAKSISGGGFPMALTLMRPELDIWLPGEHSGTFRGFQAAMVGATAAIEYSIENDIIGMVEEKANIISQFLYDRVQLLNKDMLIRGIGMMWGIDFTNIPDNIICADDVSIASYQNGLIVETAGRNGNVLKIMPPLTTEESILLSGLTILHDTISSILTNHCGQK